MSIIQNTLRPFWLPRLNDVAGKPKMGLSAWTASGNYQIFSQIQPGHFALHTADPWPMLQALAFDCNRMATAAFESIEGIFLNSKFPRTVSWLAIQAYYSAFYAAHAILRIFGSSCSQLNSAKVNEVADVYGYSNGIFANGGFYLCTSQANLSQMDCAQLIVGGDGSHGAMWAVFYEMIVKLSDLVLTSDKIPQPSQETSAFLVNLAQALKRAPIGNSLSAFRNAVNYQHLYGLWYPYLNASDRFDGSRLLSLTKRWRWDPLILFANPRPNRDLRSFIETCTAIVSFCRELIVDMQGRCSDGKSFLNFGAYSYLNKGNLLP